MFVDQEYRKKGKRKKEKQAAGQRKQDERKASRTAFICKPHPMPAYNSSGHSISHEYARRIVEATHQSTLAS